jgi:hypothetical protein
MTPAAERDHDWTKCPGRQYDVGQLNERVRTYDDIAANQLERQSGCLHRQPRYGQGEAELPDLFLW